MNYTIRELINNNKDENVAITSENNNVTSQVCRLVAFQPDSSCIEQNYGFSLFCSLITLYHHPRHQQHDDDDDDDHHHHQH